MLRSSQQSPGRPALKVIARAPSAPSGGPTAGAAPDEPIPHLTSAPSWLDEGVPDVFSHERLFAQTGPAVEALRRIGVRDGDEVAVHLPLAPESVVATLACGRLGASRVTWPVTATWQELAESVRRSRPRVIITADAAYWGHAPRPLKPLLDRALAAANARVRAVLVVSRAPRPVPWTPGRDRWWHEVLEAR